MKSKKNFIVTNPPAIFWLCLFILVSFVILTLAYTIFSPPPHTAMYVCFAIIVFIPGTIVALWTKAFKITVSGTKISVRKHFGFVHFSFDVSEISEIKWKTVVTKAIHNEIITIFTSKGKRITVETVMVNSNKMIEFIEKNVDPAKIKKTYKKFKNA